MNLKPCDLSRRSFLATGTLGLAGLLVGRRPWGVAFRSDELERRLKEDMERHHIPGLAVCVVKGDRIVWSKGFGFADLAAQVPMNPADSIQNIGSISKTVTATAVMQLAEQRRINLDEDVNAYLGFAVRNPRFPDVPITCRHLLTHRSSIKDGPAYGMSYTCGDPTVSRLDWLAAYLTEGGEHFDPEQNFHTWKPGEQESLPPEPRNYSNVGFGLLGCIVEKVAGVPFAQYCETHLFEPLVVDLAIEVAFDLRVRIAHLPEPTDEGVALVVLLEPEKRCPLLLAEQDLDLGQPLLVLGRQVLWSLGPLSGRRDGQRRDGDGDEAHHGPEPWARRAFVRVCRSHDRRGHYPCKTRSGPNGI